MDALLHSLDSSSKSQVYYFSIKAILTNFERYTSKISNNWQGSCLAYFSVYTGMFPWFLTSMRYVENEKNLHLLSYYFWVSLLLLLFLMSWSETLGRYTFSPGGSHCVGFAYAVVWCSQGTMLTLETWARYLWSHSNLYLHESKKRNRALREGHVQEVKCKSAVLVAEQSRAGQGCLTVW